MTATGSRVGGRRDARRFSLLPALRIRPSVQELVRAELDAAIGGAEARLAPGETVAVLDAGCGRVSALRPFRARIGRFVGADIHEPAPGSLPHLDEFVVADLCGSSSSFPSASFDVILSSFTIEHFADPSAAFANFARWLRPGGVLLATTVNRRHPFVRAYLGMPAAMRRRAQPFVKASSADAHPIVGACNDPGLLAVALGAAGFASVRVSLVGHLARAWGRRLPTYLLGLGGDLAAQPFASRRSTMVAVATVADARE